MTYTNFATCTKKKINAQNLTVSISDIPLFNTGPIKQKVIKPNMTMS